MVSKEVNAVNSEHEKNLSSDFRRFNRLDEYLNSSNEGRSFRKFATGNKKSLEEDPIAKGINVRQQLLDFHAKWYSANIMTLAVLGRQSLEELEAMVIPLFQDIQNNNVESLIWHDRPVGPEQMNLYVTVVPVKNRPSVALSFPFPRCNDQGKVLFSAICYLTELIGRQCEGSLLSALKSRGWCNGLNAGTRVGPTSDCSIKVDLTFEGLENVDNIITLIFQYLNMIRDLGPQKWIFEERSKLRLLKFHFQDKKSPISLVKSISYYMVSYEPEEVLIGRYTSEGWQPELITEVLDLLVPSRARVVVASQAFDGKTDCEDEWYGTKFKIQKIEESKITEWENCGTCPDLCGPKPNIFIPENFDILAATDEINSHPIIIHNSELSRLWFKQDQTFKLPRAVIKLELFSPLAQLDPLNASLCALFVSCLKDSLNEYSYDASLAGLSWDITETAQGLQITVEGYNDKLPTLYNIVLERLVSFQVDEKGFEQLKDLHFQKHKDFENQEPYEQASYYMDTLKIEKRWSKDQLLAVASQVTSRALQEFIPCLLNRIYIEGLVYGNVNREQALSYISTVEEKLSCNGPVLPLMPQQLLDLLDREIQLLDGKHYVYEIQDRRMVHSTSAVETYFQCGVRTTQTHMELELLATILDEPFFHVLRTKEQLGYIVFSGCRRTSGVQGLKFLLQSDRHPKYLLQRVEAFLVYARELLTEMTDEKFENHKDSLAALWLEKPTSLDQQCEYYSSEIASHQYDFGGEDVEAAYLQVKTITRDQIIEFFDKFIAFGAPGRKQLTVQVISSTTTFDEETAPQNSIEQPQDEKLREAPKMCTPILIDDITSFKRGHGLYPLPQLYIDFNQNQNYEKASSPSQ